MMPKDSDVQKAPADATDGDFVVLQTVGYRRPNDDGFHPMPYPWNPDVMEVPDPALLPQPMVERPFVTIKHNSGARVTQLLKPGNFEGWVSAFDRSHFECALQGLTLFVLSISPKKIAFRLLYPL